MGIGCSAKCADNSAVATLKSRSACSKIALSAITSGSLHKGFLTEAHVQAAKVYEKVHPRRGRPRRIRESNPGLPHRLKRIVKRTAAA